MKRIIIGLFILASTLTVACSSSKGSKGGSSATGSAAGGNCTPNPVAMGDTVTCSVSGLSFEDGDTVSIEGTGNTHGIPVASQYDGSSDNVTFVMPSFPMISGNQMDVRVVSQGGSGNAILISKMTVKRVLMAGAGSAGATDSDVIAPTGDSGSSETPAADGSTGSTGATGDTGSTGATGTTGAPAPTPLDLKVEDMAGASKQQTVKITWKTDDKVKAIYLAGNLFNRTATDTGCKLTLDKRYLVTAANGVEIDPNPSTPVHVEYEKYLEGKVCDNGNTATDDDCDFTWRKPAAPYATPASSPSSGKYSGYKKMTNPAASAIISGLTPASDEPNPDCRIDLPASSGEIYTRSLVHSGDVCLVVVDEDGTSRSVCDQVVADHVQITTDVKAMIKVDSKIHVSFDYVNATSEAVIGGKSCVESGTNDFRKDGSGHASYACDYSDTDPITMNVQGYGMHNTAKSIFKLSLGAPYTELICGDDICKNGTWGTGPETHNFVVKVGRPFDIKETIHAVTVLSGETTAGITYVMFNDWTSFLDIPLSGHSEMIPVNGAVRDHNHWAWQVRIIGAPMIYSNRIEAPYNSDADNPAFKFIDGSYDKYCHGTNYHPGTFEAGSGSWTYDSTDFAQGIRVQNLKEFHVDCKGHSFEMVEWIDRTSPTGFNPDSYAPQGFYIKGNAVDTDLTCTFSGVDYSGHSVSIPVGWGCPSFEKIPR